MVIGLGYEFSPNIMGIQEGYNKNFHIKCIEYYEKFDSLHIVLRYEDGNMRVMLVSNCELEEILVLKFVIPVACTYGEPLCNEVGA
jgi:hypothetical protein